MDLPKKIRIFHGVNLINARIMEIAGSAARNLNVGNVMKIIRRALLWLSMLLPAAFGVL